VKKGVRHPLEVTEAQIQADIVMYLQITGWTVLVTNAAIRKIAATPGVPDLLATRDELPEGCWLGLEVKKPEVRLGGSVIQRRGELTPEQKVLKAAGRIYVVDSIDQTKAATSAFLAALSR